MSSPVVRELVCANCGAPLPAPDARGVVTCSYCARTHMVVTPPDESARTGASYAQGDRVRVLWGGSWWAGRIERVVAAGVWEISYDGWSSSYNEVVESDRLAPAVTSHAGGEVGASVTPRDSSGTDLGTDSRYAPGQAVQIEWRGKWWPGHVLRVVSHAEWEISYDGYGSNWNEIVGPARILPRHAARPNGAPAARSSGVVAAVVAIIGLAVIGGVIVGTRRASQGEHISSTDAPTVGPPVDVTTLHAGSPVQILWSGRWYSGRIVQVVSSETVRIHYDGYDSHWDETVPLTRVRYPQ